MRYMYLFFLITLILQPLSQLLEKKGMVQFGKITSFGQLLNIDTIIKLATNPYIVAGVILSVISLLFWLAALSSWNISVLYPLGSSLTQVIMVLAGVLILQEQWTLEKGLGVVSILIGGVLLNWR